MNTDLQMEVGRTNLNELYLLNWLQALIITTIITIIYFLGY